MASEKLASAIEKNAASTPPPLLALRLFGAVEVRVDGRLVERLPSRRGMWLLAILAIRNGRPIERQRLAGLLWPDSSDAGGLHNLRQTLAALRRSLGPAGAFIESASPRSILLRATPDVWVDLIEFDEASRDSSLASLKRAVDLYRGPLLPGCDEPFAREEREVRERSFIALAEQLANHYVTTGDAGRARHELRRVIAADPYRESAYRTLMSLLGESGETAAALDLYRNLRLSLRNDLNAEPDPETTAIYRALRSGAPAKQKMRGEQPKPDYRIPSPLTPLLGRDAEVREASSLLERCRLVTLTGVGGVGKTRLAVAVAEGTGGAYLDGARFVDLAPLRDPFRVASTIASSLEVPEQAGRPILDVLAERLRDLNLLIVLDNCEHLLQGVRESLEVLLTTCRGLHVLATSRQSIGVVGELVWRVPSLAVPDPVSSPGAGGAARLRYLLGCDSVRLFLDRAGQSGSVEAQSEAELEAIGSICRQLDGIPLAIELAAARSSVLSPIEIEERLRTHQDLPARTGGTVARHQTLAAAMEWSWDLLTEGERRMLTRLCVFRGGCTLDAVEAISSPDNNAPALDLLASLVDHSMIVSTRHCEGTRFTMLETIRQFVTDRLHQTEGWEAYFDRHRDFFLEWVEVGRAQFVRGEEETAWFKSLESEHDNLRAAMDWSHTRDENEKALRLAIAMARFWDTHGHVGEGRARLELAIERAKPSAPPELARAHVNAGWMATVQHDSVAAREHYELALAHFRHKGDRSGMAKVLNCLAISAQHGGDLQKSLDLFHQALELFEDLGVPESVAIVLANLGDSALLMNENALAKDYLERSLATVDPGTERHKETLALTLCSLSLVDFRQGRYEAAKDNSLKALTLFVDAATLVSIPEALSQVAIVETAFGNWRRVANLLGASQALAASQGVPLDDKSTADRARAEAETKKQLGPDAFSSEYGRGAAMEMEQALQYAFEEVESRIVQAQ